MPDLSPIPVIEGGSRFGSHFINLYRKCRMKWFNQYHRPHPSGGIGLESPVTPEPLMLGWLVHEGLAAWYNSGWKDGQYDLEAAFISMEAAIATRSQEFEDPEKQEDCLAKARDLLLKYHQFYGPGGTNYEWPAFKIAEHEGSPLIECNLEAPMGYKDYCFTGRLDAVCTYNGSVWSLEHKTSAASSVSRLFQRMGIDTQASGQLYLLQHNFPELEVSGVMVNVIVKNAAKATKTRPAKATCIRNSTTRRPIDLQKFRRDVVATLVDMEEKLADFQTHVEQGGMTVDDAARLVFEMNTQHCVEFGNCQFYPMCKNLGNESLMSGPFRPRSRPPTDNVREGELS